MKKSFHSTSMAGWAGRLLETKLVHSQRAHATDKEVEFNGIPPLGNQPHIAKRYFDLQAVPIL